MNISLPAVFANSCNYLTVNLVAQLSLLQKKVAIYTLAFFSCAALGYTLYRYCTLKAQELPKEESPKKELPKKEIDAIDALDDDKKIEGTEQKREEIEVIDAEEESEQIVKKAPNLANAKVTSLISLTGVCVAIHDIAMDILAVGWTENHRRESSYSYKKENGAIYDLQSGNLKRNLELKNPDVELRNLKIDPVHQQIIGGLKAHHLGIWNSDGSLVQQFDSGKEIESLADGSFRPIFAKCWDTKLKQFNPTYPSIMHPSAHSVLSDRAIHQRSFMYHDAERNLSAFSSLKNKKIQIIQLNNQSVLQELDCSSKDNFSLYSQEKGHLIYCNPNNQIVIHDVSNHSQIQSFDLKPGEELTKMLYHEQTNRLIACTTLLDEHKVGWMRSWIRIWDVETGDLLNHFMAVNEKDLCYPVSCMLYFPEFDLLFTGSSLNDRDCCVWDLKTGILLQKIQLAKALSIRQMSYDKQTNQLYITQNDYHSGDCETSVIDLS